MFQGLDQNSSCNFDSFMKEPATPSKRSGRSKVSPQEWKALTMAQQYEILVMFKSSSN